MNPFLLHSIFAALLLCSTLVSCSSDPEKKEKSAIEQGTDKAAKEAVEMIKTPIDQAKMAAEQENAHTEQVEEQAKTQ